MKKQIIIYSARCTEFCLFYPPTHPPRSVHCALSAEKTT